MPLASRLGNTTAPEHTGGATVVGQSLLGAAEGTGELALAVARSLVLNALTLGIYSGYELGSATWAGYEEGGFLGALNAVNPLYQIGRGGADTALAIDRGDYRAAGAAGTKAVLVAAATVFGMGRGLGAIAEEAAVGVQAARVGAKALPEGSFSIIDWTGYPAGAPRPSGPFRLLSGAEYAEARSAANSTNQALHAADPTLKGLQIHEITPVKFGGSPTDLSNKIAVTQAEHAPLTTFWNRMRIHVEGGAVK